MGGRTPEVCPGSIASVAGSLVWGGGIGHWLEADPDSVIKVLAGNVIGLGNTPQR